MSSKEKRVLAAQIVKGVDEALNDFNRDDIEYALAKVDSFIAKTRGHNNMHYTKARKALMPLRNTLSGVLDADSFKSMSTVLVKYEQNILGYVDTFKTEFKNALKIEAAKTAEEANKELSDELTNQRDADMLGNYINVVRSLPKSIDDGFEIVHSSILPTFNKVFKLDDPLKKAKIAYDKIDIYYIFKEQTLLAFGIDGKTRQEQLNYVEECIDIINESGNTKYVLVTDRLLRHPNSKRDIMFAWIMENRQFQRLFESTGSFSVKQWSFPTKKL